MFQHGLMLMLYKKSKYVTYLADLFQHRKIRIVTLSTATAHLKIDKACMLSY